MKGRGGLEADRTVDERERQTTDSNQAANRQQAYSKQTVEQLSEQQADETQTASIQQSRQQSSIQRQQTASSKAHHIQ